MAATQTVQHRFEDRNSAAQILPRHGVITLFGYGIRAFVERGHLHLEDGIGTDRRAARLARVRHGLRRLVVVGSDGMISLSALRWLANQDAAFVMLDSDGSVLATTGPVRPSDARLRRAQALGAHSHVGLRITRELIDQKLAGQESVAGDELRDAKTAQMIASIRSALPNAATIERIRYFEAQAGYAYWRAWRSIPVVFPKGDSRRVPEHWRTFGTRISPITGSPRLAVNPPNAILNYLYALLESEARLAIAALGLDPGLGFLHTDKNARDSFAFDVMEPVRPQVDAYVLRWMREQFARSWFFEERNGNCRLMGSLTTVLSETMPTWQRAVAPIAESVARALWSTRPKFARRSGPATRLTQSHRRTAKGGLPEAPPLALPKPPVVCKKCGAPIKNRRVYCTACTSVVRRESLVEAAKAGRVLGHSPKARASQAEKQKRHATEAKAWQQSSQPEWLTGKTYQRRIQPLLAQATVPAIASALGVSEPYAALLRSGRYRPHPRHWQKLAALVNVSEDN